MPDPTSDAQTQTVGLVKSGSGSPVVPLANVPTNQYASNAELQNLVTNLTQNTRASQAARAQLDGANKTYSNALNALSTFQTSGGNLQSIDYTNSKTAAINAEQRLQAAQKTVETQVGGNALRFSPTGGLQENFFGSSDVGEPSTNAELDGAAPVVPTGGDAPPQDGDSTDDIVVTGTPVDHRVRIRAKAANEDVLYGAADSEGVTAPLRKTRGVIFPYTPTISMAHTVNYSQMTPVHANTDYYLYTNTPAVQISISGQFSAQNDAEARYMLAAMHFFRTITKMHFGETDENKGLPPPIVILSGHGDFMLNGLSGVVTSFSMDLPNNVDYLEITVDGHQAFVPALTTFNINFVVQQTPRKQRDFNFDEFASGELMNGSGWI